MQSGWPTAMSRPSWSRVEMAALPDILHVPGLLVWSSVLLILGSNPVWGNNTTVSSDTTTNFTNGSEIAKIVAPTFILGLAFALAVLACLLCKLKKKRQTEGTYRPSAEEQCGARSVETPDALKLPKEERLI